MLAFLRVVVRFLLKAHGFSLVQPGSGRDELFIRMILVHCTEGVADKFVLKEEGRNDLSKQARSAL